MSLNIRLLAEQISDLFHIDFEEGNGDSELGFVWIGVDVVKDMVYAPGDDSTLMVEPTASTTLLSSAIVINARLASENGVSFPAARLAVCHNYLFKNISIDP